MGRILKVPEPDTSKKACKYQLQHCCGAVVEIESNELERPKSMNWDSVNGVLAVLIAAR